MPRELRLFDRDGAGVVAGDTRVVMMLREFIVGKDRNPWGIGRQNSSATELATGEEPDGVG